MKKSLRLLLSNVYKFSSDYHIVAELTDRGYIHFHMLSVITNDIAFAVFLNRWQSTYGFTNVKHMSNDNQQWDNVKNYIYKDDFKKLFNEVFNAQIEACDINKQNVKAVRLLMKRHFEKKVSDKFDLINFFTS